MTTPVSATSYSVRSFFPLLFFNHGCSNPTLSRNSFSLSHFYFPNTHFRLTDKYDGRKRVSSFLLPPRALQVSATANEQENDNEDLSVLFAMRSEYNDIVIVDSPKARYLLLDSTNNVHSIYNKVEKWTDSYWDEFASLPAVIPQGPVALLGLGGGTAAHLLLGLWPSLQLEGWEIDRILVDQAREYLELSDLEQRNQDGGVLNIHVGDAFSPSAVFQVDLQLFVALKKANDGQIPSFTVIPSKRLWLFCLVASGIVVDLFSDGKVLSQLQEVETWLELSKRLMPNGRFMVNCGGANPKESNIGDENVCHGDSVWLQNSTIEALCKAFPGNLNWKKLSEREGANYMALTGPMPDLNAWASLLPDRLRSNLGRWRPCKFGEQQML